MADLDFEDVEYYEGLWHSVRTFVKLMIRARAKAEPDFLTAEDYSRWGLPDIVDDTRSAESLLREALPVQDKIIRHYIGPHGSGGVSDDEPFGDFRMAVIYFTYDDSADFLKRKRKTVRDWADAFQWELLPRLLEGLDRIKNSMLDDPRKACPVKLEKHEPPSLEVLGKEKRPTQSRYDVIKALVDVYPETLSKDILAKKSKHSNAVNMLKAISKIDADWKSVVKLAGETGGGYGLRVPLPRRPSD